MREGGQVGCCLQQDYLMPANTHTHTVSQVHLADWFRNRIRECHNSFSTRSPGNLSITPPPLFIIYSSSFSSLSLSPVLDLLSISHLYFHLLLLLLSLITLFATFEPSFSSSLSPFLSLGKLFKVCLFHLHILSSSPFLFFSFLFFFPFVLPSFNSCLIFFRMLFNSLIICSTLLLHPLALNFYQSLFSFLPSLTSLLARAFFFHSIACFDFVFLHFTLISSFGHFFYPLTSSPCDFPFIHPSPFFFFNCQSLQSFLKI